MASSIFEFFGFRPGDNSLIAREHASKLLCPILNNSCEKSLNDGKRSGVCSLKPKTSGPVICCPIRLYAENYKLLADVSLTAFGKGYKLVPSREALSYVSKYKEPIIAVFGKKWGREIRLPQKSGNGGYFVDWVLAKINTDFALEEFIAVEVQAIDSTGNYRNGITALELNRDVIQTSAGLNWENVSKRIIPQLIYKGQVLQREELCKKGLFFVCPEPVMNKILNRLGGLDGLIKYSLQPASITFVSYNYVDIKSDRFGEVLPLVQTSYHTTTVYKLQEAFNNVSLPVENVYRTEIIKALEESKLNYSLF